MEDIHIEEYKGETNDHLPMHERVELLEMEMAFLDRENAELWQIIIDNGLLPSAPNPIPVPGDAGVEVISNYSDLIDYVDDDAEFIN